MKDEISETIQDRSERNRVDRENMIQECKNPIVEDDFHGFLHRNCEGTEQLRCNKKTLLRALHEKGRLIVALPPFFTDHLHAQPPSDIHQHLSTITGGIRRSLLCFMI